MPSTYKKAAIPMSTRRAVALKYGCRPGEFWEAPCAYCDALGRIQWFRLRSGRPSAWVWFEHEMDHEHPESLGGAAESDNIVLACRTCNRRKGAKV